jgi:3-methyladenine DNA glycosylase Mpg
MDAIFQMDKDQQEEVMRTAIELYTRNELRNKRIQDDIHNQISQGLPPGKLVKYLEIEINDDKQEKKLEDAYTIQARSRPTITKHSAENW